MDRTVDLIPPTEPFIPHPLANAIDAAIARTVDPDNFHLLVLRSGGSINTTGHANPRLRCAHREGPDEDRRCGTEGSL